MMICNHFNKFVISPLNSIKKARQSKLYCHERSVYSSIFTAQILYVLYLDGLNFPTVSLYIPRTISFQQKQRQRSRSWLVPLDTCLKQLKATLKLNDENLFLNCQKIFSLFRFVLICLVLYFEIAVFRLLFFKKSQMFLKTVNMYHLYKKK